MHGWRIGGTTLSSRVARRTFAVFVLATVAPVAVMALLVFGAVSGQLLEQGQRELEQLSKMMGAHLYERLLAMRREMLSIAAQARSGTDAALQARIEAALDSGPYRRVEKISSSGTTEWFRGSTVRGTLPPPMRTPDSDRAEGAALYSIIDEDGLTRTFLRVPVEAEPAPGHLVAELDLDQFATIADALPYETGLCVRDGFEQVLLCSSEMARHGLEEHRRLGASVDPSLLTLRRRANLSAEKTLFLEAKFRADDWTVTVSSPKRIALANASDFADVFPFVLVLAILVILWLSILTIRRASIPLERLREHTRQLSAGDFSARIRLDTNDEYEDLGEAFNRMAAQLGNQFAALAATSEIDRLILGSRGEAVIVDAVLAHVGDIVNCDMAAMLLVPADSGATTRVEAISMHDRSRTHWTGNFTTDDEAALLAGDSPLARRGPDEGFEALAGLFEAGRRAALLFPVVLESRVTAVLIVAYSDHSRASDLEVERLRSLCDHIGVAFKNVQRERVLHRQAHFDGLTGLPNRFLLEDRIAQALTRADRQASGVAVMFMDIDRFKAINDAYGHGIGDELLRQIGANLRETLRASDTVGRFGGDEFVVLLQDIAEPERLAGDLVGTSEKLLDSVASRYRIGNREMNVTASIGIATYPRDGSSVEDLLRAADSAMYHAKERGGTFQFYSPERNQAAHEQLELETGLHRALELNELELYYQPQRSLLTGAICGAEALLRWNHPERGLVMPLKFLPAAVDSGQIVPIGEWALEQACHAAARLERGAADPLRIGVNLAPAQFLRVPLEQTVERVLAESGLEPQRLELEITEDAIMADMEGTRRTLNRIRALGVRITLDDFGTGFSSLSYLQKFPIHALKIDRAFTAQLDASIKGTSIVQTIIALAHNLGLTVVAEGVEREEQLTLLREYGCDEVQGFLCGEPVPWQTFTTLLGDSAPADASAFFGPGASELRSTDVDDPSTDP